MHLNAVTTHGTKIAPFLTVGERRIFLGNPAQKSVHLQALDCSIVDKWGGSASASSAAYLAVNCNKNHSGLLSLAVLKFEPVSVREIVEGSESI
jgi:hypothetical protein